MVHDGKNAGRRIAAALFGLFIWLLAPAAPGQAASDEAPICVDGLQCEQELQACMVRDRRCARAEEACTNRLRACADVCLAAQQHVQSQGEQLDLQGKKLDALQKDLRERDENTQERLGSMASVQEQIRDQTSSSLFGEITRSFLSNYLYDKLMKNNATLLSSLFSVFLTFLLFCMRIYYWLAKKEEGKTLTFVIVLFTLACIGWTFVMLATDRAAVSQQPADSLQALIDAQTSLNEMSANAKNIRSQLQGVRAETSFWHSFAGGVAGVVAAVIFGFAGMFAIQRWQERDRR